MLSYKNVKLAVVEAKSIKQEVGEGVAQAKIYAQKLRLNFGYAANGKEIYEIDFTTNEERLVDSFPTPQQLWQRRFSEQNEWLEKFVDVPFEDVNGTKQARYYQKLAVNRASYCGNAATCATNAGYRYRQNVYRIPNCLETV